MSTNTDPGVHWQGVYETKAPTEVSWYQPVPEASLRLIGAAGLPRDAAVLDIGAGASTLVDHLLDAGFRDVTVLDIAPAALAHSRVRLGARAGLVHWITTDIRSFVPQRKYDLWHDRAVLHFLTDPVDRASYVEALRAALAPGGHVVLATFAPDGPPRCSGLPVERYDAGALTAVLGPGLQLERSEQVMHVTPAGRPQPFRYGWWRRVE